MEAFLDQNFRKIVMLAIVAAGAVAVVGLVRYKSNQTAQAAAQQVSSAKTVEDCDLVVQKYPGSVAAGNALLLKADLLWKANKKDSALGVLREFTKGFPKHPFFLGGLMGLASKLESTGEKAEAKSIYERFNGEFSKSEFAPVAQVRLGDLLWADGKDAEAKKHFEQLPGKYPGELSVSMSQNRIDLIDAGLPTKEVDGPPQPKKEDKPAGPTATSAPVQITPGGVTPIKLEAGKNGTISPTIQVTPQGTVTTGAKPSIQLKPGSPTAQPPGQLKMIEPSNAIKPGANPPAIKLGAPLQKLPTPPTPPAPASVKVDPSAATPSAPAPKAPAPSPAASAPESKPSDPAKK